MEYVSVRSEIEAANRRFAAYAAARDYAGVVSCYTADAHLLPPGGMIVSGAAVAPFWEGAAKALGLQGGELTTLDLDVQGDTAIEMGQAVLTLNSGPAEIKYLVVWKRQPDGTWQRHRDMWNGVLKK